MKKKFNHCSFLIFLSTRKLSKWTRKEQVSARGLFVVTKKQEEEKNKDMFHGVMELKVLGVVEEEDVVVFE